LDGIHIYRHGLPIEAGGPLGYVAEYAAALFHELRLAVRVLRERGIDVIQACNPPDTIFLVAAPFKLLGKRFVFDHHDLNPELLDAKFGRRPLLRRLLLLLERCTFALADVSIATNESYRRVAIERGRMAPDRVFVVRSGPSLERMRIGPPNEALKRGRRFLVGYVGVIGRQEGIDLLLEAARVVIDERGRRDVLFAVVGDGTDLERCRDLAASMGLAEDVVFTGRLPDAEMLEVLNTAELCVNPDRWSELNDRSTMNKIVEYMALGKPIVQFDMAEGRWSAQDASLYARPDDAHDFARKIVDLLDDPERRRRMGAFGRERVETALAWTHEAPKLLEAYDAVWAGRPGTVPSGRMAGAAAERP
jgi:glycosyltransferase involved in cell wall biosynthesis